MSETGITIAVDAIAGRIVTLRGQRIMLDSDLAALYGVPTKRLNEQVKRNAERFPADFMFRLNSEEIESLNRSQIATGSQKHRDPRFSPFAFTEHGAIMAATVLNSPRAVEVSIFVVLPSCSCASCLPAIANWPSGSTNWRRASSASCRPTTRPSPASSTPSAS